MSNTKRNGIFRNGQLQKEVRVTVVRSRLFSYMWVLVPDRRQLIHKGRKP